MILNFGGPKSAIDSSDCIIVHSCILALLAIALLRAKLGRSCSCSNIQYRERYKITISCCLYGAGHNDFDARNIHYEGSGGPLNREKVEFRAFPFQLLE
jgi:hypothetical protein